MDKNPTLKGYGHGYYQCYCKDRASIKKLLTQDENYFCREYEQQIYFLKAVSLAISLFTTIMNVFLRVIILKLIDYIRFDHKSQVSKVVMTTTFISMYINTAFIVLLSNADFRDTILRWIPINNNYNDFVGDWYVIIGQSL